MQANYLGHIARQSALAFWKDSFSMATEIIKGTDP